MLRPECIHSLDLAVEEFADLKCRFAYEALVTLTFVQRVPVDLVTIEAELCRMGRRVPTIADLADMAARVPTAEDVVHWATMVRLAATQRRVRLALTEQLARIDRVEIEEIASAVENMQRTVIKSCGVKARFSDVATLLDQVVARLRSDSSGENARVKTGLWALDQVCGGLPLGHPTMVGGRTSAGKTALMRNVADNIASRGIPVGYVSLEDAPIDLVQWQALRRARVPIERIVQGSITAGEIDRLEALRGEMARLPLSYCHEGALDGAQVCQRLRQMVAVKGIRVGFVDFLQRAKVQGKRPLAEELGDVVVMLCDVAADTGAAIVIGSQLNRESEKDKRPPTLIDFKGCGGIEENAELAILVHRQSKLKADPSKPRLAKLMEAMVAKMKLGEPRTARLFFEGSFGYVCDPERGFFTEEMDGNLPRCLSASGCERYAIHGEDFCGLHLEPKAVAAPWFPPPSRPFGERED